MFLLTLMGEARRNKTTNLLHSEQVVQQLFGTAGQGEVKSETILTHQHKVLGNP